MILQMPVELDLANVDVELGPRERKATPSERSAEEDEEEVWQQLQRLVLVPMLSWVDIETNAKLVR